MDTNILIHAIESKPHDARKGAIAREIVLAEIFGVSAQTIAEFVNVATKARISLPYEQVAEWIDYLAAMPFTVLDADLIRRGFWFRQRYQIQYYDGALLAAAERLGCETFLSEDLNHGQRYGDVVAINPYV